MSITLCQWRPWQLAGKHFPANSRENSTAAAPVEAATPPWANPLKATTLSPAYTYRTLNHEMLSKLHRQDTVPACLLLGGISGWNTTLWTKEDCQSPSNRSPSISVWIFNGHSCVKYNHIIVCTVKNDWISFFIIWWKEESSTLYESLISVLFLDTITHTSVVQRVVT